MIFQISNLDLQFHFNNEIKITDNFKPFLKQYTSCHKIYDIYIREIIDLIEINGDIVFIGDCYQIVQTHLGLVRVFFELEHRNEPYAIGYYDFEMKQIHIYYRENGKKHFNEIGNSFYHIGWEALLLYENRMILHSCSVDTQYGGILFSGDSGIGKSTQGNLWIKYQNANMINGDRTILSIEDKWKGYGSPYAGSSRCYKNESIEIKAIVFLKQSKKCSIKKIVGAEAFQKIYAQLTINSWDEDYVTKICYLIEKLINDIDIYELSCTPDKQAVDLLSKTLEEDDYENND